MTVQWQTTMIPLAGGPDTKADPRALEPPKLLLCDNGQFEETGGIQKRGGTAALGLTKIETGSVTAARCRAMGVRDDELLLYAEGKTRTWIEKESAWADRGFHEGVLVDQRTPDADRSDQYLGDGAETANVIVYAWYDTIAAGVRYRFYDKTTRAVIPTSASTFVASASVPRCRAVAGYLHVYYISGTALIVDVIDPADVYNTAGASLVTLSSAGDVVGGEYDVDVNTDASPNRAILAYRFTGSLAKVMHVRGSDGVSSNVRSTARSCTGPLAIAYRANGVGLLRVVGAGEDELGFDWLEVADLTDNATVNVGVVTGAPGVAINHCTLAVQTDQDEAWVYWSLDGSTPPTFNQVRKATVSSSGTVGTVLVLARQASLASRATVFLDGSVDRTVVMVHHNAARVTTGSPARAISPLQPTYFLLDGSKTVGLTNGTASDAATDTIGVIARLFPSEAVYRVESSDALRSHLPQIENLGSSVLRWVGGFARRNKGVIRDTYAERGLRDCVFTFFDPKAYRGVQEGKATTLPGGYVATYDGTRVYESGFFLFPEAITVAMATPGGVLSDGTYNYRFRWEWQNAKGEREWSSYCGNIAVTFSGGGAAQKATFTVPTNPFTKKSNVYLAVFRTAINSAGPFYRISPMDPGLGGFIKNNINADTVTFVDDTALYSPSGADGMTDLELVQQAPDYQADGELDSIPPPCTTVVAAGQGRVFTLDPEDRNLVWFSKLRQSGDAVMFNDTNSIQCPGAGGLEVTGLEVADNAVVIFKEDAIYVASGNGPSNVPTGLDSYGEPQRVADIGCDESSSIIRTPVGIFFRSKKGPYLLDGGYQTHFIGAEVIDYFAGMKHAVHLPDLHQVRWYGTTGGYVLMYDYLIGEWSRWTGLAGLSAVVWQDTVCFLVAAGPMEPYAAAWTDAGTAIVLDVQTAHFKPGGLAGFVRGREIEVVGEFMSAHSLRIRVYYDYSTTATDDQTWTVSPASSGPERVRVHLSRQKFTAVSIRITDVTPTGTGEGLKLTGLGFVWGAKTGLGRLPAAQQK